MVNTLCPDKSMYVEMKQHEVLYLSFDNNSTTIGIDPTKLDKIGYKARLTLQEYAKRDYLEKMELFLITEIIANGPKIFKPTAHQLFMLENMKLNLTFEEFVTPFPAIVVDLPEEYAKARSPEGQRPYICSALYWDAKKKFILHNVYDGQYGVKSWGKIKEDNAEIEDWFSQEFYTEMRPWHLKTTEQELFCETQIKRAIMNYCLLLDEVGIKKQGPANPNEYSQLVKWCQKQTPHTKKNKALLQAQPIIFALDKKPIELVRVVDSSDKLPAEETGRKVSPHSRRGHYRMQPHGPNSSLRKRIRIPCTIVNKKMLTEPLTQEYKT